MRPSRTPAADSSPGPIRIDTRPRRASRRFHSVHMFQETTRRIPEPAPDSRLRDCPPWRATLAGVCVLCLAIPIMLFPMPVARLLVSDPVHEIILAGTMGTLAAISLIPVAARILAVDHSTFFVRSLNRHDARWWLIGLAIPTGLVAIGFVLGWVQVEPGEVRPGQVLTQLIAGVIIGLWTGTVEESIMRGVLLSIIGHRWSWPGAIFTTALVFGLLHHDAASGTVATGLYIAVTTVAGLLFGLVVVSTGNIVNAIALHATWNSVFNEFVLAPEPTASGTPIAALIHTESMIAIEGAALPESPLSLAVFCMLTIGYWFRITHRYEQTERHIP